MAPLVKEFQKYPKSFEIKICVTAQHREMLDQVLEIFEISPDYDLNVMKSGQDLYDVTANVLLGMRDILNQFSPDIAFVHGDTSTTFAAALACFYKKIPVAHVEAGLRTHDMYNPWPEEANRQLTGKLAKYHFTPTTVSEANLHNENITGATISVTGNTVIDALFLTINKIRSNPELKNKIETQLVKMGYQLKNNQKIILVTGHRRENFGEGFINICEALKEVALSNPDIDIVYPVHLNPNVQKPVKAILSHIPNIYLIEPLSYEPFVYLMNQAYFIITDSGGIQEEAPSLGKPVLVLRDTTERPEAVEAGTVKLVGTNKEKIIQETQKLINDSTEYEKMAKAHNPYGDGNACHKIVKYFMESD